MSKLKIMLVISILVLVLVTILAACTNVRDISSENNGTGNYPDSFDLEKPVFTDIGGMYEKAFTLKVHFPDRYAAKGYNIYYTLDSSEPTKSKGILYSTDGIKIPGKSYIESNGDFVTVVRAACFDAKGEMVGKVSTATYIKPYSIDSRYTMPVISLVTDIKNLTNKSTGIFNNIRGKGKEWERPVHVQFYEDDGSLAFSQDAGIRLFGGSSRGLPQKSFKINARESSYFDTNRYDGTGEFLHEIFPGRKKANGETLAVYNSFILRNAGNDSLIGGANPERATHMRDGWASRMAQVAVPNADTMAYRPAVVYLNGEYYGILGIRENQDENYIKNVYGIEDVENIAILSSELDTSKGGRYGGLWFYLVQDNGPEGELENFDSLGIDIDNRWISYSEITEIFDMQNIIEFYAFNLLICNNDWPHNNVKLWRYTGENKEQGTVRDGRWRFMFKDQDLGLGRYILAQEPDMPIELYTKADSKNFRFLLQNYLIDLKWEDMSGYPDVRFDKYPDSLKTQRIINLCLKEEEFRSEFRAFSIKLATELLTPDIMIEELQKIYSVVEPEIVNQMHNNGMWRWDASTDLITWKKAVLGQDDSLVTFARERSGKNGYFLEYMDEALSKYR